MEDSSRTQEPLVGTPTFQADEELAISACQRALTSVAAIASCAACEIVALDVADQQAVVAGEERVVVPAGIV